MSVQVADLFRDPSAGIVLNIEVAKLMFLFETPVSMSLVSDRVYYVVINKDGTSNEWLP